MAVSQFNGVVPGSSLTSHKVGDRPWERPPEMDTVEEALSFYMSSLSQQDTLDDLMVAIETGVAIKPLVESLYTASVMRGMHTLDVGILVAPALMEFFAAVAESYGIDYKFSNKDPKKAMDDKERARVTMLLQASIRKAEQAGEADEGTDLLRDMAEYTSGSMTREEAEQDPSKKDMKPPIEGEQPIGDEEPIEGEEVMQEEQVEQMETPPQSGGLMAKQG